MAETGEITAEIIELTTVETSGRKREMEGEAYMSEEDRQRGERSKIKGAERRMRGGTG